MPQPCILPRVTPYFLYLLLTCHLAFNSLPYSSAIIIKQLSPTSGSAAGGYTIYLEVTVVDADFIAAPPPDNLRNGSNLSLPIRCIFAPQNGSIVTSKGHIFLENHVPFSLLDFPSTASASCPAPTFYNSTSRPVVVYLVLSLSDPAVLPNFVNCTPPLYPCPSYEFYNIGFTGEPPRTWSSILWRVIVAGLAAFVCIFVLSRLIRYRVRAMAARRAFLAAHRDGDPDAMPIPDWFPEASSLPESKELEECVAVVQPNEDEYPALGIKMKEVESTAEEEEEDEDDEEKELKEGREEEKKESALHPLGGT